MPEDLATQFANHMLVTHIDGQFILTFFEAIFPVVLEGNEDKLEQVKSVQANAITRIAIPPRQIPGVIQALSRNYERFMQEEKEREEYEKKE